MTADNQFDDSDAPAPQYAVVYAPQRKRERVPEQCVELVASEAQARARADTRRNLHAARVMGPMRSSEGIRVFFVVQWL